MTFDDHDRICDARHENIAVLSAKVDKNIEATSELVRKVERLATIIEVMPANPQAIQELRDGMDARRAEIKAVADTVKTMGIDWKTERKNTVGRTWAVLMVVFTIGVTTWANRQWPSTTVVQLPQIPQIPQTPQTPQTVAHTP